MRRGHAGGAHAGAGSVAGDRARRAGRGARAGSPRSRACAPQAKVDPGEVAALGYAHAEQHAQERARARIERARWDRLSPRQRAGRIAAARRQTATLNRALVQRTRDDVGYWEPSLVALPEYAIHAAALPTGKILIFGREPLVDGTRSNRGSAIVFDPATGLSRHLPPPPIPDNPDGEGGEMPAAIFCSGQALLSDGRVLLAGGNLSEPAPDEGKPQYAGLDYTFIFDPWTETWEVGPRMSHGRWYPTLTKLSSGDVLIASGLEEDGQGTVNPGLEIYHPGASAATPLEPVDAGERGPAIGTGIQLSLYPGLFLLPNGNVALAGPGKQDSALLDTAALADPGTGRGGAWTQIPETEPSQQHYGGSPVLEPQMNAFSGSWNILVTGGADSNGGVGFFPARSTVDRLTAGPGPPVWTHDAQDDQQQARFYPNDVLLPDGGIAAIGGGLAGNYTGSALDGNYYVGNPPPPQLKQVELRRPGERTWRLGAAQQEYRTYHSTAALLADGRVMSAGDDGHEGPLDAPIPPDVRRDSAEFYWPPYLFDGDECALRPVIRGVGATGAPANRGRAMGDADLRRAVRDLQRARPARHAGRARRTGGGDPRRRHEPAPRAAADRVDRRRRRPQRAGAGACGDRPAGLLHALRRRRRRDAVRGALGAPAGAGRCRRRPRRRDARDRDRSVAEPEGTQLHADRRDRAQRARSGGPGTAAGGGLDLRRRG